MENLNKKNTVRKKMSLRDYVNLMNYFQTGELEMDLSEYDKKALAKVETRVMRFSAADKAKMDEFFSKNPFGVSVKSVLDTIPKAKANVLPIVEAQEGAMQSADIADADEVVVTVKEAPKPEPNNQLCADKPWLVDPKRPVTAENIDVLLLSQMVEKGELNEDKFIAQIGNDVYDKIIGTDIKKYYNSHCLPVKYSADVVLPFVFTTADRFHQSLVDMMNEEAPSEEETLARYTTYILNMYTNPVNKDLGSNIFGYECVTSATANEIMFDNDAEEVYEYEKSADMENDMMFIALRNKVDFDMPFEVFGKKYTINKIVKKLYDKFPEGLPDKDKFYHTRLEAYEDGAIQL